MKQYSPESEKNDEREEREKTPKINNGGGKRGQKAVEGRRKQI